MTYIIGLTGGIGSGKTVVSNHFSSLGVPIVDTDVIARLVVEPGQATLASLVDAFGESILMESGHLNRGRLRELAFANTKSKVILDTITHPAIYKETLNTISSINATYCLVVVPLLTQESPFLDIMRRILVVTADIETRIQRVQKRSGLERNEVERIMRTQLQDDLRLQLSDDIIENNKSLEHVYTQVEKFHANYLALANRSSPSEDSNKI